MTSSSFMSNMIGSGLMNVVPDWVTDWTKKLSDIEKWASDSDWACRRIEKQMKEKAFGKYKASGLMLQKDFTKILLEPIGSRSEGKDGVIDMYMMPMYDDMATIVFENNKWNIHYLFSPDHELSGAVSSDDFPMFEFQEESFNRVLNEMTAHAA